MSLRHAALAAAVLLLPPAAAWAGQAPSSPAGTAPGRHWLAADGAPLPLQTRAAMEDFLRTAEVVRLEGTARGVAGAQKAFLRKDGLELNGVFRTVAIEERQRTIGQRTVMFFRDHYVHEPAAYALSELLGVEMVPPAVLRSVGGVPGSMQLWLEDVRAAVELREEGVEAPDKRAVMFKYYQMQVFDNLINNQDRNQGNILVDDRWCAWLIDHTRAFVRDRALRSPAQIRRVERGVWEKLRTLSDAEIDAAIEPYLPGPERAALLERRRLLVELIQEKIDLLGEDGVLFDRADLDVRL